MKMIARITVSVLFIILMVGAAYAWDDDVWTCGYPPIWQIFKKGKAVRWVDWKDNRRFAIYDPGTPNDPSDDMVLDKETGFVWERSPSTSTFTWIFAQSACNVLTTGGRLGWRLPTLQELASLADPNATSAPFLPPGNPFSNVQSGFYWSGTTYANNASFSWVVNFGLGNVNAADKSNPLSVWCVRGGQGVDPQ